MTPFNSICLIPSPVYAESIKIFKQSYTMGKAEFALGRTQLRGVHEQVDVFTPSTKVKVGTTNEGVEVSSASLNSARLPSPCCVSTKGFSNTVLKSLGIRTSDHE